MSEEVLVVAVREVVRPGVGAAALLPGEPGLDHAGRELQEEAELERLREIVVENIALVVDDDALVAVAEAGDDRPLALHLLLAAEDAEVFVHRRRHLVAYRMRPLALGSVEELVDLPLRVGLG